jgi:hypothetical protein
LGKRLAASEEERMRFIYVLDPNGVKVQFVENLAS